MSICTSCPNDNVYTLASLDAMVSSSIGYGFSNWTPYQVPKIDWKECEENAWNVVDAMVRELVVYDDFYSTIWIDCSTQWEERLDDEGIIDADLHAQEHHYYDFPCCVMYGSEFVVKERFICMLFRALHLVVCNHHDINRDSFMRKYEDLHDFYSPRGRIGL